MSLNKKAVLLNIILILRTIFNSTAFLFILVKFLFLLHFWFKYPRGYITKY